MEFRLVHLYPDLMNLYGSYANLSVLRRLLERLGHRVRVDAVVPEDGGPGGAAPGRRALEQADFVYMGAGTERRQRIVMKDASRYGRFLKEAAEGGVPMLFAGTAMELIGARITDGNGEAFPGLGLSDFVTVQGKRRIVGDVYGVTDLYSGAVVGFMNKCGLVSGIETPLLLSLSLGFGNERERGAEGFHQWNVFGSELTGPILVKNPRLLEAVASAVLEKRGAGVPAVFPVDPWAEKGYAVTEAALMLRCPGA